MNMTVDMNILSDMAWRVIHAFILLFWNMLWPLAVGFLLSAWVRTRVPASLITSQLGKNSVLSVLGSGIFGCISSVCNYAVTGMSKTLYDKGATWPNVMIYMLASTNLGITMLLAVYGFLGVHMLGLLVATTLISMIIVWVLSFLFFPADTRTPAPESDNKSKGMWLQTAIHFYDDVVMTQKDITVGIAVAALASGLVPAAWWQALFMHETGASVLVWLWNAVLGLILAFLTFGCSIGNVALAAVLWWNGGSPGGVMAFMLGSLLTAPMLHIYYRNFGARMTWNLAWVQVVGVVSAALIVDALIWWQKYPLPRGHASADSGEAALILLILNIILGGIGLALYLVGGKHSSMGGMMGMGGMGGMDHSKMHGGGMGDMKGMDHGTMNHATGMAAMNGMQHEHMQHEENMGGTAGMQSMQHMDHTHMDHAHMQDMQEENKDEEKSNGEKMNMKNMPGMKM